MLLILGISSTPEYRYTMYLIDIALTSELEFQKRVPIRRPTRFLDTEYQL